MEIRSRMTEEGDDVEVVINKEKSQIEKSQTRSSPHSLVGAVKVMNLVQKKEIEEMGFGNILELKLNKLRKSLHCG